MKKIYYVFSLLLVLMIGLSVFEINSFQKTKEKIKTDIFDDLVINVKSLAKNISIYIDKNYKLSLLKNDENTKNKVDTYLSSFISHNYKNMFIVYKKPNSKFFIALADGSKKEKFDFKETFEPLNKKEWEKVLKNKKPIYFKQKIKDIWMTYLYPVLDNNNNLKYIIVTDFSTKPLSLVSRNLDLFRSNVVAFTIVIFISIIILLVFLVYDYKRQHEMQHLVEELKLLNETLEEKVKNEVEKNRQKDKQLMMQSRMALMGELLSMIAHQWRQPLNTIGGIVSNIKLDIMLGEFQQDKLSQTLDKIENLILHLSHTIDDFRKFYREENDNDYKTIKISKLIDETLNITSSSFQNNHIKIILNIKDDIEIYTMPNRLKQVFLNVIKNGLDSIKEREVQNPYIKIDVFKENDNAIIEIKDNAKGIDKEIIDKIFDPYFTTKDEKNGTGIGLYMSKMIIEKLNGRIIAYNDEVGAVFRIELKENNGN